jgi:multidrug resistance efflux pump
MPQQRGFRWFLMLAAIVSVAVTGAAAWRGFQPVSRAGAPASAEDGEEAILAFGYVDVEPGLSRLSPARAGKVMAVLVRENQQVEAGEALVRLDDESARRSVQQARAELAEARAQLAVARELPRHQHARLAQQGAVLEAARFRQTAARHEHERRTRLAAKELCGEDEVRTAADQLHALDAAARAEWERLADLEIIDPALPGARAKALVEAREAQLKQAEHALRQCTLTAPEAGTVLRVLVASGEILLENASQPAIYFCPNRPRILRAEVTQEKAARLALGQPVLLEDDGDPSLHWRGKVQRVSDWYTRRRSILQDPLEVQDVRTVECIIEPESAPHLRIGQKIRVTITPKGT